MSVLSLYIPVIQKHISEAYIKRQFLDHNIGKVLRVDFVKNIEKNRREAFVHFDEWFDNEVSLNLQKDIINTETKTRFVYNKNKFFPLLENKNAHRRINNPKYEIIKTIDAKNSAQVHVSIPMDTSSNDNISSKKQFV